MREFRLDGYRNIYELLPNETKIYGTETLYGDWDAELLLLAKDFAPVDLVETRIARFERDPYRHGERTLGDRMGHRTNDSLRRLMTHTFGTDRTALYGSVLAGLMRLDGSASGSLPNHVLAMAYGVRVLEYVTDNMPWLRAVLCLGSEAWECATTRFRVGQSLRFDQARGAMQPAALKSDIGLFALFHPAARISNERKCLNWEGVGTWLDAAAPRLRTQEGLNPGLTAGATEGRGAAAQELRTGALLSNGGIGL